MAGVTHDYASITEWRTIKSGKVAKVYLYAGDTLKVHEEEFVGPTRVSLYARNDGSLHVRCRPLNAREFNLDDPLEYPCGYCGAHRGVRCSADCEQPTFRVFSVRSAQL